MHRVGLFSLLVLLAACEGRSTAGHPQAEIDAAADATGGAASDSDAPDVCIPFGGACDYVAPCCGGHWCLDGKCTNEDPACVSPGGACDGGWYQCCEGKCTDGKCPPIECHGTGQSCGPATSISCCAGLQCHQSSCFDPKPCALENEPCGKGCCQGLSCDGAGQCQGSLTCSLGIATCFECLSQKCCGTVSQCQSVGYCGTALSCLESCVGQEQKPMLQCASACTDPSKLIDSVIACASSECSGVCNGTAGDP